MGADDNATENLVISAWQAIELVGDARERSDEIEPIDLEAVLAQAEEILFSVISGLARFDRRLTGKPRGEPSLERALRHNSHAQTSRWGRRIATLHAAADGASSFAAAKLFPSKLPKCASDGVSILEEIAKTSFRQTGMRVPNESPAGNRGPALPRSTVEISRADIIGEVGATGERPCQIEEKRSATGFFAAPNNDRRPTAGLRKARVLLTGRLFLLIAIAVAPVVGILAWHECDLRITREADIRNQVVQTAKQLGGEIGVLREGARQMLLAVAQVANANLRQPDNCSAIFSELKSRFPNYSQLGAADTDGRIFCASGPITNASVANQPFFTRAMAREGLAVGNYWADPISGLRMIHFAQRFNDSDRHIAGVVFAGLDLTWLCAHLKERVLPPTGSILIADREGNIIARLPHSESLIGKNMRKSHEKIMDEDEAGWEEAVGVDGVTRIFGYVPPALPPRDFFLSVGQTKSEVFAGINSATRSGTLLILGSLFAAICVAWVGSRKFISRPVEGRLKLTNGNDDAKVHSQHGDAFNGMADGGALSQKAEEKLNHPKRGSDYGSSTGRTAPSSLALAQP